MGVKVMMLCHVGRQVRGVALRFPSQAQKPLAAAFQPVVRSRHVGLACGNNDVDLSFRLNQAGHAVLFEPAARVLHHISASYGKPGRRLLERQSHNEERVFWRNVPRGALWRALPRHVAVLAGKAWRRWQEGTLTPFALGRLRVLGELPELLRHRRRLRGLGLTDMSTWRVEARYWG